VQKRILRHIYKIRFLIFLVALALGFKVCKKCKKTVENKSEEVTKNAEFHADFKTGEKV
jgi:hypothetical protein